MKIDPNIITIVEHILIKDIDTGEVLLNQRAKNPEKNNTEKTKQEDK
jgi:hypothetical protein